MTGHSNPFRNQFAYFLGLTGACGIHDKRLRHVRLSFYLIRLSTPSAWQSGV
jgi:hypothetical protein